VPDSEVESRLRVNVKKILKPELINRFDEIITFSRLNKDSQLKILNLLIRDISKSLKDQKIALHVNKTAKDYLLKKGYSKEYGARALRRTMEKELLDKTAEFLLDHTERPLKLVVSCVKGKLRVKRSAIKGTGTKKRGSTIAAKGVSKKTRAGVKPVRKK
jgi:ATP-dependent Clp protease ATP-binding subunit ClpL